MEKGDEELLREYAGGRRAAFSELVDRHLRGVYSFVLRFVGDSQEAEDIVQETFVKAWRGLGGYDERKSSFKTWLLRIARNTAVDHLRKRRSIPFSEFSTKGDATDTEGARMFAETVPDESPLPDELLSRAEDAQALTRALAKLSPAHREVLLLYYTNDLTFEELGTMLGESPNTIKSRHRRALAALRAVLAGEPGDAPGAQPQPYT